jgi:hypothetical protein
MANCQSPASHIEVTCREVSSQLPKAPLTGISLCLVVANKRTHYRLVAAGPIL